MKPFLARYTSLPNTQADLKFSYNVNTETLDEDDSAELPLRFLSGSTMTKADTDPTTDEASDRYDITKEELLMQSDLNMTGTRATQAHTDPTSDEATDR